MYINNRQKIEDNKKEINDNNRDKKQSNSKGFNKVKLSKLNKNISQLKKLQQDKKIVNPFIRCSSDIMMNKYQIEAKEKQKDDFQEEVLIIKNLWDELGITKEYQMQFNNYLQNENLRKTMFFQEKEKLQKFRNSLMKLRKEIIFREKNIESLIKIIKILESQRMQENILNEIISIIKSLRLNAVNIVFYMMKIRELAFYYYFQGKWDLTKIKRDYLYNNNYLLKMRDDLSFLNNSILRDYIEMNNIATDAFLTNCSKRNNNQKNKIIIPITDELEKLIEQCKFIIIEDQLLDNIYNNNYTSQIMSRASSGKIRIRKNISLKKGLSKNNNYNYLNNNELNNSMSKYQQNYFNSINLSKTIYQLKNDNPSNYNSLFLNNQIPNIISISNLKEARKKFESARIKLRSQDKNKANNYVYNYQSPKKIIIEHDSLNSYDNKAKNEKEKEKESNNKIFKSNENCRTSNNYNINSALNSNINRNNAEREKIDNIIKENEKLKIDNEEIKKELQISKEKMEKNENLRKNLEKKLKNQKDEMEKLANSVEEIKLQLINEKKELEKKLEEEKEKNQGVEKIKQEMEKKLKNQIINKEIEIQINKNIENKIENNIENNNNNNNANENNKTESIKEEEYIQNKTEENKNLNNNENEREGEIKEVKDDLHKNDNENNENNNYLITNSERNSSMQKSKSVSNNSKEEEKDENINYKEKNISESNEDSDLLKEKEKEKDIIHARQLSEKIVDELMKLKEYEISPNNKYKAEYYKGDITLLINKLKESMPLEKIDNRFLITFDIENNIYNEDSYLIGQYPQIIVCKSYENESRISGVCSFYFHNSTKNEKILKINFICTINESKEENEFEQFITMINFIKYFVDFEELYITLNYNQKKIEEEKIQYNLDKNILEFFKIKMKFSWVCIQNIEGQGRQQQLCYKNEKANNNNNSNPITTEYNKEFFNSETIYLLSFFKKDKEKENTVNINKNYINYKYINFLPIYAILTSQNNLLQVNFKDNKYRVDTSKLNLEENPIITAFFPENKTFEELKSQLSDEYDNIYDIIEDSLFLEYYKKDSTNIYSYGFFKMNLNIYFNNILITKKKNYYYNRINSDEIEVINDIEYNCQIYNIPSLNKINNLIIFELNDKTKKLLLDNNLSIYELFIKFFNLLQIAKKDNLTNNNCKIKNIYIPCFKLDVHLQTEKLSKEISDIDFESIDKNNSENNTEIKIGTVDEFLKIDFEMKKQIDKQIMYEANINEENIVLENEFILGIINNYTEIKYPLFQLIYVTKECWVKIEDKNEKE